MPKVNEPLATDDLRGTFRQLWASINGTRLWIEVDPVQEVISYEVVYKKGEIEETSYYGNLIDALARFNSYQGFQE